MASPPLKIVVQTTPTTAAPTGQTAQNVVDKGKQEISTLPVLRFPADLNNGVYMSFQFYDYRNLQQSSYNNATTNQPVEMTSQFYNADRKNIDAAIKNTQATKKAFAQVFLPIPQSLVDAFRVDYENTSLGMMAGVIAKAVQNTEGMIDKNNGIKYNMLAQQAGVGTDGAVGKILSAMQESTVDQAGARGLLMGGGQDLQNLFDLSTGVATNPNLTVMFKGPTLKEHTFQWKLSPRTAAEARTIQQIIGTFKRAMHATRLNPSTSLFLKYPCECLPQFHGPRSNFLYPLRPCVVEDFTADYGPNGGPSWFQDGYETSVQISIRLQETSYYTRESFSDESQYGYDGMGSMTNEGLSDGAVQAAEAKKNS